MRETKPDEGTGQLRPERLGESFRLRPERLGLEAAPADGGFRQEGGWALDPQGTTMGRILRFATAAEMRELVADLQGVLDTLESRRPSAGREGPVTLMVFFAGHRVDAGGG